MDKSNKVRSMREREREEALKIERKKLIYIVIIVR
jgi:hypothetical protein